MKQVFAAIAQSGLGGASDSQRRRVMKRERTHWKRFLSPGGGTREKR